MRVLLAIALALVLLGCDDPVAPTVSTAPSASRPASEAPEASPSPGAVAPTASDFLDAAARGDWRPAPLPVDNQFLSRFEATCVAAQPEIAALPAAVRELRGEGLATVIFGQANRDDPSFLCRGAIDASTPADLEVIALDAGRDPIRNEAIDMIRYEVVGGADGDERTVLVGRVGRMGIRVLAAFADGSEVEGAKGGGWYAMWWPGSEGFTSAAVVDRQNVAIGSVAAPGPPAPAP